MSRLVRRGGRRRSQTAPVAGGDGRCGLRLEAATVAIDGREVLRGVDLEVRPGELVALVGPNGAGKTTALRALADDVRPAAGAATLDGRPLAAWRAIELARRRAVLPQTAAVEFAFSVREVVQMGRAPHAGTAAERDDDRHVDAALAHADVAHLAARSYRSLSGGEQARVQLARVLAQDCGYLLLDEPTAALDLRHQETVMAIAAGLAAAGRGVLAVVHDLNLAAAYASHLALLARGTVLRFGRPADVLTDAALSDAYRTPITVSTHPTRGCPLVLAAAPADPIAPQELP
ncbi:MAG: heme ABC transporter ATP-binding protein [Acidimicrobiia bacterium]